MANARAKGCLKPVGMWRTEEKDYREKTFVVYGAGTSCVDVSAIGSRRGLLGDSSKPLAIWLSEILITKPDAIVHECTGRFMRSLFGKYLPDYDAYTVSKPQAGVKD